MFGFPTKDFKTVGKWAFNMLRPPTKDIATIGRALPQVKTPFGAVKKTGEWAFSALRKKAYEPTRKYFEPTEDIRVRDIARELPYTGIKMLKFGTTVREEMSKSGGSLGLSLHNIFADIKDPSGKSRITEFKPEKDAPKIDRAIHQFVFGKEPIKAVEQRIREGEKKAIELGVKKKYALPVSIVGVGAIISLDFTGFGGGKKTVVKMLAKMDDVADISKVLRQVGVADDLVLPTAKKMKTITNAVEIEKAFDKIDLLQKSTKVTPKAVVKKEIIKPTLPKAKPITKVEPKIIPKIEKVIKKIPEVKPEITPAQKITKALKEAKPLRKEQEAIYTKERGIKLAKMLKKAEETAGEKGFYSELGALKGKMTKVEFASIRDKISQTDIDDLFDQVKVSQNLSEWDKLPARKGLAKMLGEEGGVVPTKNEMDMMKEVFGDEFVKTISEKRTLFAKIKEAGIQLLNVPRSIMASFDLSAPLRQGLFFIGKPKHFFSAFKSQFKVFGNERAFKALNSEIASRPTYNLMKQNKLALTDLGSLSNREEAFLSNWAEEIPFFVGKGVRASSRAYTGFLNKMRADVFDDFIRQGERLGIDDPKFLKSAANFVNTATGRGGLGPLEKSSVELSTIFFSPRLTMSRLNLINPVYYAKLEPTVRKEALKSLFSLAGIAATIGGLAKMGGADVNIDPRNADFMKLKFGNTRYDILGGFQQPIRTVAQVATGKIISSTTGEEMTLGEGYKPLTRVGVISRYFKYKMSPVASFAYALMEGQTAIGEKVDIPTEVANRFIPMVANDMYELYKEQGLKGIPMGIPAIFGVGSQTYGGVQSYGMEGKKYPELNNELNRLKMSMGFPSTSAFGYELTNKEYKEYKKTSGKMIAEILSDIIKDEFYLSLEDKEKKGVINKAVDKIKKKTKEKEFADKKIKQEITKRIIDKKGLSEKEAEKLAEEIYQKEFGK